MPEARPACCRAGLLSGLPAQRDWAEGAAGEAAPLAKQEPPPPPPPATGRTGWPGGLQSAVFLGCPLRGLCLETAAFLTASWVVCPPRPHLWGLASLRAGLGCTREPTAMRFSAQGLAHVPPPHGSEPPCLSACLCSFQAAPLSRFRRIDGRVLRGTGGGKRSGRHLSCSQSGWKHTVSPVLLISRCLNYPLWACAPLVIRRRPALAARSLWSSGCPSRRVPRFAFLCAPLSRPGR